MTILNKYRIVVSEYNYLAYCQREELVAVCLSNCVCLCLQTSLPGNSVSILQASGKHPCSHCGRSFTRKYTLRRHEAAHNGSYACWCKICGKGCLTANNLRSHMATHTGIRDYNCDLCTQGFTSPWSLTRHKRHLHKLCVNNSTGVVWS